MRKKRRFTPYVVGGLMLLSFVAAGGYYSIKYFLSESVVRLPVVRERVEKYIGPEPVEVLKILPRFFGFSRPETILFLLQNNTELRPAGGFIGSYAVLRINRGKTEVLVLEGSETLDRQAPADWRVEPPATIKEHLHLDRWYFRDSNWSPDFAESAKRALEFYRAEGGVAADKISLVVGITPTVLEELLRLVGPLTVDGITFAADNVVEKLEYEVEYGYRERGLAAANRKDIIGKFLRALMSRASDAWRKSWPEYLSTAERLVQEKHILAYAADQEVQKTLSDHKLTGQLKQIDGDYLMWVDANLGALKTDHAIERDVRYEIHPSQGGGHEAVVAMTYNHKGAFDWRTTRYQSYARVYVPLGAELLSLSFSADKNKLIFHPIDQGQELEKQWFGAFVSVEPGDKEVVQFVYRLPSVVTRQIADDLYTLFVQKQPGTIEHGLTLDLDFGTTIKAARPAEKEEQWHDSKYQLETDLRVDRKFEVRL